MIDYDFSFDPLYRTAYDRGRDSWYCWWDGNPYDYGTEDAKQWMLGVQESFRVMDKEKHNVPPNA
jgi:hypothetical protein